MAVGRRLYRFEQSSQPVKAKASVPSQSGTLKGALDDEMGMRGGRSKTLRSCTVFEIFEQQVLAFQIGFRRGTRVFDFLRMREPRRLPNLRDRHNRLQHGRLPPADMLASTKARERCDQLAFPAKNKISARLAALNFLPKLTDAPQSLAAPPKIEPGHPPVDFRSPHGLTDHSSYGDRQNRRHPHKPGLNAPCTFSQTALFLTFFFVCQPQKPCLLI